MARRILFVGPVPPARGCGPQVITYRHLNRLKGWQVSVLCDRRAAARISKGPLAWEIIDYPRGFFLGPHNFRKIAALIYKKQQAKPSVILNHLGSSSILAYYLSKMWGVPLCVMIHDPWEIWTGEWLERYYMRSGWVGVILNHASRVWTYSLELADVYKAYYPKGIKIIYPIPEGGDADFAVWQNRFKANPVVAFAGAFRLHEVAYFRIVAKALQKINGTLLLATTNNYIVKPLLCNYPNIKFKNPCENREIISFLKQNASSILIPSCFDLDRHPWRRFNFPAKLTEYSHLGLPIIILAPRGIPLSNWAVRHNWLGYVDTLDVRDISGVLKKTTEKENWEKMAKQSRTAAATEFNPAGIQLQFESELIAENA